MSIATFWATSHWGDYWHQRRYIKVSGKTVLSIHSGRDINGHPARTAVPALAGGRVTEVGRLVDIGGFVEVQVAPDRFDVYCHIIADVAVGQEIPAGALLVRLAGVEDAPGSMWGGPHLHFMTANRPGAARNRGITLNPDPNILAALAGGGSGGSAQTPVQGEDDVRTFRINTYPDSTDGAAYVQSGITGNMTDIRSSAERFCLEAALNYPDGAPIWPGQAEVVRGYLQIINPPAGLDVAAITAALDAAREEDTASIIAAIGRIQNTGDPAAVATALEAILADDFERVNLNIDEIPTGYDLVPKD